jgi:hypothetical protein
MPATYDNIATTTLTTTATSITFSSIPATYTDLVLVVTALASTGTQSIDLIFNSDSGSNYSQTRIVGNGSTATSSRNSNLSFMRVASAVSTTIPGLSITHIFSYAGSTNKTVLTSESEDQNGSGSTTQRVQLWRNTAAINRIDLNNTSLAAGTTATIYGVKNA